MEHHEEPKEKLPKIRKPFHKHLGHHARRFHKNVTKYLYERDTIFATLWVFIFILGVKFIPLNLHFLDPMKLALEDFDFNDIAYSKLGKASNTPIDNRIVVINIGHMNREEIGMMVDKAATSGAKVIGLDAYFAAPKDPHQDSVLREVFQKTKNLVVISRIHFEHHGEKMEFLKDNFDSVYHHRGYANLIGEEKGSIRQFSPFEEDEKGTKYPSFATALVQNYDPAAYEAMVKRHNDVEVINYARKVKQYLVISGEDLLMGNVDESALKGKIVLLGYISTDEFDIEDMVFTPMNEKFAGKSTPDMNGIIVHANIISMILDRNYIKKLPLWFTILAAVVIGWLHMSFFVRYYLENHIWFHLVAKIAQIASAIFFVWLGMMLFDRYRVKLNMSLTVVVIVLAVDIIYFYEAFAVWMHKRFKFRTVFHQHHHG